MNPLAVALAPPPQRDGFDRIDERSAFAAAGGPFAFELLGTTLAWRSASSIQISEGSYFSPWFCRFTISPSWRRRRARAGCDEGLQEHERRVVGPDDLGDPGGRRVDRRQAGQRQHLAAARRHMLPAQAGQPEADLGQGFAAQEGVGAGVLRGLVPHHGEARLARLEALGLFRAGSPSERHHHCWCTYGPWAGSIRPTTA